MTTEAQTIPLAVSSCSITAKPIRPNGKPRLLPFNQEGHAMTLTTIIPNRLLVYARQSVTERKVGSCSINSHIETGRSAGNEKFPGVPIFAFSDPDTSGDSELKQREGGSAMMRFAEPGDCILLVRHDRIFRSLSKFILAADEWKQRGIAFMALNMPYDYSTPEGELIWHIMMSMAQIERQQAIERTKDAMRYRRRHGLPCNRKAPVGFKVVGSKGTLRFEDAPLERLWGDRIRKMKEQEGRSLERIAWDLAKQYRQAKDDYQRQYYANPRTGGPFSFTQVRTFYKAASTGYPIVTPDTCRKMIGEFCDGLKEASRGIESENETLRTMAESNAQAFKYRQRELFENPAVRHAVTDYLNRKKRRDEYEDELLTMLLAM